MKFANYAKEVPTEPHFAIITFGSHWQAGYDAHDMGQSNPCPEYYEWTMDRKEWEEECLSLAKRGDKNFVPLEVKPRQIKQTFSLS